MVALRIARGLFVSAEIVFAVTLAASSAAAQREPGPDTRVTVTGAVITFPTPTTADYNQGFVNSTSGVRVIVEATKGNQSHTTTISIRSTATTLGGGKPLSDLQWRREDLAEWIPISLVDTPVESRIQVRNRLNDPWTKTIFFRILLDWAHDPAATYFADYQITLSQTAP